MSMGFGVRAGCLETLKRPSQKKKRKKKQMTRTKESDPCQEGGKVVGEGTSH